MTVAASRSDQPVSFQVQYLLILLGCFGWFRAPGAQGDLKWQRQLGSCIVGAPAFSGTGEILAASCDGTLYSLTTAGSNNWSFSTPVGIVGVPTVAADGTIYFGSDRLYALNADGSKRWDFVLETYSSWNVYAEDPAIGPDGVVYVARPFAPDGERRLYAVNPDGTLRWKANGRFLGEVSVGTDGAVLVSGASAGVFTSVNPDGTTRWGYAFGNYALSSAAVAADGTVLVPVNGASIYDGAVQATTPGGSNVWRYAGGAQALGSPVVGPDGKVYYAFDNGRVVALESDGQLLWEYTMPGTNSPERIEATPALASDGTLYFAGEHYLHALDASGQLLWRFDCGTNQLGSPLIGLDGTVYAGDSGGALYAVEGTGAGLAAGQWPMSRRNAQHQASAAGVLTAPPAPAGVTASFTNYTDRVLVDLDQRAFGYALCRLEE